MMTRMGAIGCPVLAAGGVFPPEDAGHRGGYGPEGGLVFFLRVVGGSKAHRHFPCRLDRPSQHQTVAWMRGEI